MGMLKFKSFIVLISIGALCTSAFKLNFINRMISKECLKSHDDFVPVTSSKISKDGISKFASLLATTATTLIFKSSKSVADEELKSVAQIDFGSFKLPYDHVNLPFKQFIGPKATIVFNMKIDDPQTVLQFPDLAEIYKKYGKSGLNVHAFPSEQGWFEPDDDETCRAKAKEYYGFGGDFPNCVVFDKVDLLGPSAHPLYIALTQALATPNGYNRITLNYEKFLLDASGTPLRRYPRKYSAYDMEADIQALLNDQPLPPVTPLWEKYWREAKREAIKSEYAFRYNYNYYTAPDSMYKYNPLKDEKSG